MKRALALVSLLVLTAAAPFENAKLDGEAFSRPAPGLDAARSRSSHAGSGLFRQAWVIGPSQDHPDVAGLGPLYNRLSCIACHVKNGRGAAPGDEGGVARAMVLRLSKPGVDRGAFGGPAPHPVYGAQLNPEGVPGVPGEGRAVIRYEFFESNLADGTAVAMRRPRIALEDLAFGPLEPETPISPRNAPPVFGLGLLEAVPESEILALAAKNGGRANYVFDIESGAIKLGRFGLKANQPSLKHQIANAFAEDIGISSSLFPGENCTPAEVACLEAAKGAPRAELTDPQLAEMLDYIRALAPPAKPPGPRETSRTSTCAASIVGRFRSPSTACGCIFPSTTDSITRASRRPTSPKCKSPRATPPCSTGRTGWAAPSTWSHASRCARRKANCSFEANLAETAHMRACNPRPISARSSKIITRRSAALGAI